MVQPQPSDFYRAIKDEKSQLESETTRSLPSKAILISGGIGEAGGRRH
jgi:hypothetical protein